MSIFKKPKIKQVDPQVVPSPASPAQQPDGLSPDAKIDESSTGYSSLVSNSGGAQGLQRKARVAKPSLIGGA